MNHIKEKKYLGELHQINNLVSENIKRSGFVVNDEFSMADIVVMTYLSIFIFNPIYWELTEPVVKVETPELYKYI